MPEPHLYIPEELESARIRFRRLSLDDHSVWLPFFQDPNSTRYFNPFDGSHEARCQSWLEKQLERYTQYRGGMMALIHRESGDFIGQSGLLVQIVDEIEELEIAYSLLPAFRGHGYAAEAARTLKAYAFRHQLAPSLISIIHRDNILSARVAQGNGMRIDKATTYKGHPVHVYRARNE